MYEYDNEHLHEYVYEYVDEYVNVHMDEPVHQCKCYNHFSTGIMRPKMDSLQAGRHPLTAFIVAETV